VQINVVADNGGGHDRVLFVLRGELDERVGSFGIDYGVLFNPADLVLLSLDLEKAAAALEDFKLLAVRHLGHAIGDSGYPVMKVHLASRDVHRLMQLMVKPSATGENRRYAQTQNRGDEQRQLQGGPQAREEKGTKDWRLREHGQWRSP